MGSFLGTTTKEISIRNSNLKLINNFKIDSTVNDSNFGGSSSFNFVRWPNKSGKWHLLSINKKRLQYIGLSECTISHEFEVKGSGDSRILPVSFIKNKTPLIVVEGIGKQSLSKSIISLYNKGNLVYESYTNRIANAITLLAKESGSESLLVIECEPESGFDCNKIWQYKYTGS